MALSTTWQARTPGGPASAQLKITQEMITLAVFVPFSIVYMKEAPKLDYFWTALCIVAAAYFVFRSR